jgi:hypothetical protein
MEEILQEWLKSYEEGKSHLRLGQSLMLAIYNKNPQFYRHIFGTNYDCFYVDSVIPKTLLKLEETLNV